MAFPTPTYPLFEPLCRIHEAIPSPHPTELPWELPPSLAPDPASLKLIANPNSPTGAFFATQEVEAIVGASSGIVAIDEAYVDFADENALSLALKYPNVLAARTFSKAYSLCFQRIGYFVGPIKPGKASATA